MYRDGLLPAGGPRNLPPQEAGKQGEVRRTGAQEVDRTDAGLHDFRSREGMFFFTSSFRSSQPK